MEFFKKNKKLLTILLSLIVFVVYFISTDPDMRLLSDMPFGVQIVLLFGIFALAMPIIAFLEIHTDIYTDELVKDQAKVVDKASESPVGAGLILVSKSIVLLSYALIISAIIFSVKDII